MESLITKILTFIGTFFALSIDALNESFLTVMALNGEHTLDLFFGIFTTSRSYMAMFKGVALGLIYLIYMFQLFKTFFGPLSSGSEHPVYLTMKTVLFSFLVLSSDLITGMMVDWGTKPYEMMMAVDTSPDSQNVKFGQRLADGDVGLGPAIRDSFKAYGGDLILTKFVFSGALVALFAVLMLGIIFSSYIKLMLEIVERYLILAILIMFAPLCIATGVSQSTSSVFSGWFKTFVSQLILMSMSVFFLKMFSNGVGQIMSNFGVANFADLKQSGNPHADAVAKALNGIDGMFLGMLILFAWLRTGQRIDAHMSTIGMTAAQSGGGLGADLFMGMRNYGGMATAAANKIGGTNYKNFQQAVGGEMKGAAHRVGQGVGNAGRLAMGKKPKMSQDTMANYLKKDGQKGRSLNSLEKMGAKQMMKDGQGLTGDTVLDQFGKGSKISSHEAVAAGMDEAMAPAIPEGFQATEASIDGENGMMSGRFVNEDGESFDAVFSENPLGEGSMEVQDKDGNTWYATAQGDAASEFYSGNSNAVDEAVGADAAEYAGGDVEMEAAGVPVDENGEPIQAYDIDPHAAGELGINENGELENISDEAVFAAQDIHGNMHDMSEHVDETGAYIGDAERGNVDEEGNFTPDPEGAFIQDENGNVFQMTGEDAEGGKIFANAGMMVQGDAEGAAFMAQDVQGNMHDMSGQVDSQGNFVGEGTMGSLDSNGQFVAAAEGESGSHMQDTDGNVFAVGQSESGGIEFGNAGLYKESSNPAAVDLAGNQHNMDGLVNENGAIEGQRYSMSGTGENAHLVKDDKGDIVQSSDGSMFKVDQAGKPVDTASTQSLEKIEGGPAQAGMRYSKGTDGTMVADKNGDYTRTQSGSYIENNANGTVGSYSATASSSGEYVGYKGKGSGLNYARAEFNEAGNVRTASDGSVMLANGKMLSPDQYSTAAVQMGKGAALTDSSGQQFKLGDKSFNESGGVQTYAPVMEGGKFAYDNDGRQKFEKADGGGFVQDSSGQFREVGAASLETPGVAPGSVMRNSSGEQFKVGDSGGGQIQRYAPVKDAQGNIQTKGGKPQYQPSASGNHIMDSKGNMQEISAKGSGAFNFQANNAGGGYVKTAGKGTVVASDGSNFAKLAPTSSLQRFEKTDNGFRPSPDGSYVQNLNDKGKPEFNPIASTGKAGNGEPLRYSQNAEGQLVRDNNGNYVQTAGTNGVPKFAKVADSSITHNQSPQRYSYDTASESYVPDRKGDSVQTIDHSGNIQYSKLDQSTISNKGIATFNKTISGGGHNMRVQPATGKSIQSTYMPSGSNSGSYYKAGNTMYSLSDPGSVKPDGTVQRYSYDESSRTYRRDDNGVYVKGRADGATTSTYTKVGEQPLMRYNKGYQIGSARVNRNGEITIGPKDKMVNNKDGTINLQFSDGRTAKLSNSNMYKVSGDGRNDAYAGQIKFGGSYYHYQDTTPSYKSFGANLNAGDKITGAGLTNLQNNLLGDKAFTRNTNLGSQSYERYQSQVSRSDINNGRIASYVKEGNSYRPATRKEIQNPSIPKHIQKRVGGNGYVGATGFNDKTGAVRERYITESKISAAEVGRDGHIYMYKGPRGENQEVYCAVNAKSGQVPKGSYQTKTINNEKYYITRTNGGDVATNHDYKKAFDTKLKDGIGVERRAPKTVHSKVDGIINK